MSDVAKMLLLKCTAANTLNAYIIMAILTNVAQLDRMDPTLCRQSLTHNVGLVR